MNESTEVYFDISEQRAHDVALELIKNKYFDDETIADEDEIIKDYNRLYSKIYDSVNPF